MISKPQVFDSENRLLEIFIFKAFKRIQIFQRHATLHLLKVKIKPLARQQAVKICKKAHEYANVKQQA